MTTGARSKVQVKFRLPAEALRKLQAIADARGESLSKTITHVLSAHVEQVVRKGATRTQAGAA